MQSPTRRSGAPDDIVLDEIVSRREETLLYSAHQRSLDRRVLVKMVRPDRRDAERAAALAREARCLADLEHPNVQPLHGVLVDDHGDPTLVLTFTGGTAWSAWIADPTRVRAVFGDRDPIDVHLEIAIVVARVLALAHARSWVHRDVRPANVTIGQGGHVYVGEWGAACEPLAPASGSVPVPHGALAYCAPEQLSGEAGSGPWTDTYMLGATLHEIFAGYPPHHDRVDGASLVGSSSAPVAPPPAAPPEMRSIIARALHPDPQLRTRTADEMRAQLEAYRRHRAAEEKARRGSEAAERAARSEAGSGAWEESFQEASALFRSAQEAWPECPPAQRGLRAITEARIEHCLASGNVIEALRHASTAGDLDPQLRARVDAQVARVKENAQALERLVADSDRRAGHTARGVLGAALGIVWLAAWSAAAWLRVSYAWLALLCLAVLGGGGFMVARRFGALLDSPMNRRSMGIITLTLVICVAWCTGAHRWDLAEGPFWAGLMLLWAMYASAMSVFVDRWALVSVAGYVAGAVGIVVGLVDAPWAVTCAQAVLLVNQVALNLTRSRVGYAPIPDVHVGVPTRISRDGGAAPIARSPR